jgi:predicted NAD-dependent protein-ADP-ribosyltransferase YbiA (DUF1768 family)
MRLLRDFSYWLFRTTWNKHLTDNPKMAVPLAEDLRLSSIRIMGLSGYETCESYWAKVKVQSRISKGCPILIAGLPTHGKSHVARMLGKMLEEKWCNTSDLIREEAENMRPEYKFGDKEPIRKFLIEVGDMLCAENPGAIIEELFGRGNKIIAGLRKPEELKSVLYLNPFVIWVDRPGYPTVEDNTKISAAYADFVLVNDENLEGRLQALVYSEEPEDSN